MIVCAGTIALDSTHTPFKSAKRILGGSAAYFGTSASFFTRVALVSAVGNDFPPEYWNSLGRKCDLGGVEKIASKSFFYESKFDFDLQNRTTLAWNKEFFSKPSWHYPSRLKKPNFLFLNTHQPKIDEGIVRQAGAGIAFSDTIEYLTREQRPALLRLMKKLGGYVLNDVEARILSGEANLVKAGRKIQSFGPEIVVVKKGEHGGLLFYDGEVFPFPAFPLENIVDPTGAGDAFAGGFVGWLDRQAKGRKNSKNRLGEKTLKQACYYGTVMASFCVEAFGLANLMVLDWPAIQRRFNQYARLASIRE